MDDRRSRLVLPTNTERYLAAASLWWAAALLTPFSDFVAGGPEFKLSLLAPAWIFGVGFLLLGAVQWYGISTNNCLARRYTSMVQINVWSMIGFAMLMEPPAQLEAGLYLLMAWLAADIYRKC